MNGDEIKISGDMIGDRILIGESHTRRATALWEKLSPQLDRNMRQVIAVGGPSGSGKSEIGALLGTAAIDSGRNVYVISCDNYPHRPPRDNDKYRQELFAEGGEAALQEYLGTPHEIDFDRLNSIIAEFKAGAKRLTLRLMNTDRNCVENDSFEIDSENLNLLVLEGTWSNLFADVDFRIFLDTDYEATLEHRKARARDPITPFGETVLTVEQRKLEEIRDSRSQYIAAVDGVVTEISPR